jgi:hypothetical protein
MMRSFLWATLSMALCTGCGATQKQLLNRAQSDLSCPSGSLQVVKMDSRTQQVLGCGQRATYISVCDNPSYGTGCTWVLDAHARTDQHASNPEVASVGGDPRTEARIEDGRAKDGSKQLKLFVRSGNDWMVYVKATPRTDAQVAALVWLLPRTHSPRECEIKFVADGERVALGAVTKVSERKSTIDYQSSIPYASLMHIAKSERVAGRLCDVEIALTEAQLKKVRELVVRIREEQAWDEEPVRTDDEQKAAPTEL